MCQNFSNPLPPEDSKGFLVSLQEEAIPELEIDVDELLDMPSDVERGARVKVGQAGQGRVRWGVNLSSV